MTAEVWAEIRRLFFIENLSQRRIGRIMKIDTKTVKKAVMMQEYRDRAVSVKRPSKLDLYKKDITELINQYKDISGERIYEELTKAGYTGRISILRDYLRKIRGNNREAFIRVETLPGEQAQVDWGDCGSIKIGEHTRKLSCFVMVLSYSRRMYLEFTLSQRLEDFLRCHVNAFRFFNGVCKNILYDNLKSVVLVRFGREIRFNPKFEAFSGHYLFKGVACNPGSGNEKGRVESGIKYVKRNFLAGRSFRCFTDLNTEAASWRDEKANVRIHGTTHKRPVDLYEFEKDKLTALPERQYETSVIVSVKSTKDFRVKFDANSYTVPFKYASMPLTIKADPDKVMIYKDTVLTATHRRSYEKYVVVEDPAHSEGLLAMKKKAGKYKIRDAFLRLGEGSDEYLKGMIASELNLSHHIEAIFGMVNTYGRTEVLGAINRALEYSAFGCDYIKNIILQQRAKRGQRARINPISIVGNKDFAEASVEERDLNLYDNLFIEEE